MHTTLREAGPLALPGVAAGGVGVMLALITVVLTARRSKAATVAGILSLLLALGLLFLGVLGHSLGITSTHAALANTPDEMKDLLLREGTRQARANFLVALAGAALPLLAGTLAVIARRVAAGMVLAVAVAAGGAGMVVAWSRPLPPEGPRVAVVPGLELPPSNSSSRLGTWALIALTPDGLWVDGASAPSLAEALAHPDVLARNTGRLPLLVDRRVRFAQLADLLAAASASGRHQVELVVRARDGAEHVIFLRDGPTELVERPMLLTLSIGDRALSIGAVGGNLDPLPRDWHVLGGKLAEIKASFPGERTLRVTATPDTPVGDLVAALDAAREFEKRPLFDEHVVGRFTLPRGGDEGASPSAR